MAFKLFKKNNDSPPDIGEEDSGEQESVEEDTSEDEKEKEELNKPSSSSGGKVSALSEVELQRIKAQLESLNSLVKGYSERFSNLSERLGEIRSMALNNEKQISQATKESSKVVDIVKEVKPEKLSLNYQKADMRVSKVEEKINAQKEYLDTVMNEIKEIRRKMGVFVGTDALLNLNKEVKDDLFEIQKLGSKVRAHADKSEEIFIELKSILAENQNNINKIKNLDSGFSEVRKDVQKIKLSHDDVLSKKVFNKFRTEADSKLTELQKYLSEIEEVKQNNEKMKNMVEKIILIERKNERDINRLSAAIGDDKMERVKDFENKFNSILNIIDTLAGQIREIKQKTGGSSEEKIHIEGIDKSEKKEVKMDNLKVDPEIIKSFSSKKKEVEKQNKSLQEKFKKSLDLGDLENDLKRLDKQSKKTNSLIERTKKRLFNKKSVKDDGIFLNKLTVKKKKPKKSKKKNIKTKKVSKKQLKKKTSVKKNKN